MGDSEPQQANPSLSMEMSQTGAADIRNSFAAEANVSPELRQELSAIDENANGDDGGGSERGYLTLNASTVRTYVATNQNAEAADMTASASLKPEDTFPGTWLVSVGVKSQSKTFHDMLHFLNIIGVGEEEDLSDFANSFEDIASSSNLGTEYTPMVSMKMKNALWRSTGLPEHMYSPVSIADMVKMVSGTRKVTTPLKARQATGNLTPRRTSWQHPDVARDRPRSEFYRPEDLAHNTPRRRRGDMDEHGSDNGIARVNNRRSTAWGVLPRLTSEKDDAYRAELMQDGDAPVDPYASSLTDEARIAEGKIRESMLKSALKEISPFSGLNEDWLQWKNDSLACFTLAGRRMVLKDEFRERARDNGWSAEQISDANRFVWTLLKSAVSGTKAQTVFDKAPVFDGATAWWELRRKYEVLGHSVMSKLEKKLEKFKPSASEDPEDMINRFESTLDKYELFPTADIWSEEKKLRKLWKLCNQYSSLRLKVQMIQSDFVSQSRPPQQRTYEYIKNEIIGQWLSFSDDEFSINIQSLDAGHSEDVTGSSPASPASSGSSCIGHDSTNSMNMTDIDKLIDIKLPHAHAARELGGGKKGGVQSLCQALNCKEMSKAPPWRKNHLYRACFQTFINDDATTSIPLKEGRTMSKGPPRDGQTRATITIAALFF
jgi:hypothetical protein